MPGLNHSIYNLLVWAVQPLLRRKLARRAMAEPGYAVAVPERFGHYSQPAEVTRELVWVHAVSLGESRAAGILLQALRAALPGVRILLTHGTATGRARKVEPVKVRRFSIKAIRFNSTCGPCRKAIWTQRPSIFKQSRFC